jgi:prevent-host-death family protein
MATTIAQRDLRNRSAAIMDAVEAGESFVVTRNGTPVAELRPIAPARRTFVSKAEFARLAPTERIDFKAFRADLDRVVDPYLDEPCR